MARMGIVSWVALLGAVSLGGCSAGLSGAARATLLHAEQMEIFTVDPAPQIDGNPHPAPASQLFHEHQILGRAEVTDAGERARLGRIVDGSTHRFEEGAAVPDCFSPRHGVRVRRGATQVDLLICYQCSNVHVYAPGGERDLATRDVQGKVDPIFAAHGLKPAPRL